MKQIVSHCPNCQNTLNISSLQCPCCGLELRNTFELSAFDTLNQESLDFLLAFLRHRGNLKGLQEELGLSYLNAKQKLDELLLALNLPNASEKEYAEELERKEMLHRTTINPNSYKASDIIKAKLIANGGTANVPTQRGLLRKVTITADGTGIKTPKVPSSIPFEVFDALTELLLTNPGHRAKKGNARNARLGEPGCDETTAAGTYLRFIGKRPGESGLEPNYILFAVMEWAGLIHNGYGEIWLTADYLDKLV